MSLHEETEEGQAKVVRKPTLVYVVTIHKSLPGDDGNWQGYEEVRQNLKDMLDLRRFEETSGYSCLICFICPMWGRY